MTLVWLLSNVEPTGACWNEGVFVSADAAKAYLDRLDLVTEWHEPEEGDWWYSDRVAGWFWRLEPYTVEGK